MGKHNNPPCLGATAQCWHKMIDRGLGYGWGGGGLLKYCGIVALHHGQSGVLHGSLGDQEWTALLGVPWAAERMGSLSSGHGRWRGLWRGHGQGHGRLHGQALLLVPVADVATGEAAQSVERHRGQGGRIQKHWSLGNPGGRRRGQEGPAETLLLLM